MFKVIPSSLLVLGLLFFQPNLAIAEIEVDTNTQPQAFEQLQHFANSLNTFSASFEQVVLSPNGHSGDIVSGTFSLSRPNLFRWDYVGDFPQLIIGDGSKIWIYDIELEQVSVKAQPQTVEESPVLLLLQPDSLEQYFTVADLGVVEGMALLSLTPKAVDSAFQRLLIGLRNNMPDLLVLEDGFGQRTEIRFSQQLINQVIEPAQYIFVIPAGSDVIGDGNAAEDNIENSKESGLGQP
ncbi:MAG: outer membrane lipoprotein carrier protein LolA [Xanthomonadales bacterium]|nr:outer membrane lipoprotein carrier protein LolA [Xanthomonadales bacterium]